MSDSSSSGNEDAIAVTAIDSDLAYHYYKLQTHRCWVLEGIRAIAYRNVDYTFKDRPGLEAKGYSGETYQLELQNEMLKEQGLEQTSSNRTLLHQVLWVPWEAYACLIYAEIEYYERISRKFPKLGYEPLDKRIKLHRTLIQSLRDVRDSFLHPLREPGFPATFVAFAEIAEQVGHDFRIVLRDLQVIMDDYLHWLRECLMESLFNEMEHFSIDQLLQFSEQTIEALGKTLTDEGSSIAREEIKQGIEEGLAHRESLLPYRKVDYPPESIRPWQYVRWEEKLAMLSEPLPERPYYTNPALVWVPRPEDLSRPTNDSPTKHPPHTGEASPNVAPDKKGLGCLALVVRSIMLLNLREPISFEPDLVAGNSQSDPILNTVEDYRRACRFVSPFVVSLALLVEPLRLYREATIDRPELKQKRIEQQLEGDFYQILSRFRNTIFHVPDERTDYHKASLTLFKNLQQGGNREIILGLQDFYLSSQYYSIA